MEKVTIEEEYQMYLQAMKIREDMMSPTERIERKRAFFAGVTIGMKTVLNAAPSEDSTEEDIQKFSDWITGIQSEIREFAERSVKDMDELIKSMLS